VNDWAKKIDCHRGVSSGDTVRFLEDLTARRNKIAHEGDRVGRGRGKIDVGTLEKYLDEIESIVNAIESVLA